MSDWSVVNVPAVLRRKVRRFDAQGLEIPDDGAWHRRVSESEFVLAEFLAGKGLVKTAKVSRHPDLVLKFSELTPLGQEFIMSQAVEKWRASLDQLGPDEPISPDGLERRWQTFAKKRRKEEGK